MKMNPKGMNKTATTNLHKKNASSSNINLSNSKPPLSGRTKEGRFRGEDVLESGMNGV
jgi:hypothetical protein